MPTTIRTPVRASAVILALAALAIGVGGCRSGGGMSEIPSGPEYPETRPQARVLDIQVKRDDTVIRFTNTTATAIPPCRLWVNRWYSREIDGIAPGQSAAFDLYDFRDRYGEAFKGGGFFATVPPDKVVLVQLETGGEIVGLVTLGE